ncbi:MAG: hypothetical protein FWJ62_00085 [Thermaerobacter sp.]
MRSSRSDAPDVLALPVPEAVRRLEGAGFAVDMMETRPPRRVPGGPPRVLAVRRPQPGRVILVVGPGPDPAAVCEG